jgi:4-amino-4-deoxy-L-arabinose transferase-like glycosyltransferase
VDHQVWFVLGVLLGNAIGCLLAVFCLARMTDERRSRRNRLLLVLVAAWALVETARDDMLFVAATAMHMSDYEVHFFLAPSMLLTVFAVLFTATVFWFTAARPRPSWTIGGGFAVGLLLAAMSVQAAFSGRTGAAMSIDAADTAVLAAGLGAVTAGTVWLATGATRRSAVATAATLLAVCLTIAQYLVTKEMATDPTVTDDSDVGINPIQLAVFTAVAFGVRAVALMIMSMIDESHREEPST